MVSVTGFNSLRYQRTKTSLDPWYDKPELTITLPYQCELLQIACI
jgi:hypothetical protein